MENIGSLTILFVAIIVGPLILFAVWYLFYVVALPILSVVSTLRIKLKSRGEKKAGESLVSSERHFAKPVTQLGFTMADGGESLDEDK